MYFQKRWIRVLSPTKEVFGGEELNHSLTSSLVVLHVLLLTTNYTSVELSDIASSDVMSCDFPIEEMLHSFRSVGKSVLTN